MQQLKFIKIMLDYKIRVRNILFNYKTKIIFSYIKLTVLQSSVRMAAQYSNGKSKLQTSLYIYIQQRKKLRMKVVI